MTNWRIFEYSRNLFLIFFQSTKLRQPTEGRDSCLKINKYYVIFVHLTIRHIPSSFSYEKQGTLVKILVKIWIWNWCFGSREQGNYLVPVQLKFFISSRSSLVNWVITQQSSWSRSPKECTKVELRAAKMVGFIITSSPCFSVPNVIFLQAPEFSG